jgi:hypothetical protein
LVRRQAEPDAERESHQGARLGADGEEHATERPLHHEAHVEQRADAKKDKAGDQAVGEGESIDRLQPIDLQDVDECSGLALQRIKEQRSHLAAVEEQHASVNRRHPEPHWDHQQRLEDALLAEVDQHEAEKDQEDPGVHDLRLGRCEGRYSLEQIKNLEFRHGLANFL